MKATVIAAIFAASFVCGAGAAHKDYLRFTARGGSVTIGMSEYHAATAQPVVPLTLETAASPDQVAWSLFEAGTDLVSLGDGETVYFRQHDPERRSITREDGLDGWLFKMTAADATPSATVEAGGNCLSIVDATCAGESVATNAFAYLFRNCAILTTPPELPATQVAYQAYFHMFQNCSALKRPPRLPATKLDVGCYSYMFSDCVKLESAPELPATELANSCYGYMFLRCASLRTPPELPATELRNSCYNAMFKECTSLASAPALPATVLSDGCYNAMFKKASSLAVAPHLPATALVKNCYLDIFSGCSNLKRVSVAFTAWKTDASQTKYWMDGVPSTGHFICPTALTKTRGSGYIPTSWTVDTPVTVKVPRQANCTATATANGAAITGTATGDAVEFTFAKGQEDADIALEASEGYTLVGATEYAIPKIAASVTLGSGDYALPTVVRIAPECPCESAALQFDGLSFENGAITLTLGVKTVTGLGDGGWQRATVSNAALSSDGKAVTLTIPSAGPQAFFSLAK